MIGRELVQSEYKKVTKTKEDVISIKDVDYNMKSKHNGLSDISITIGKGEIVGIAGVDGNGQSQLAQLITGVIAPDNGQVLLKSKKVSKFLPENFIKFKSLFLAMCTLVALLNGTVETDNIVSLLPDAEQIG